MCTRLRAQVVCSDSTHSKTQFALGGKPFTDDLKGLSINATLDDLLTSGCTSCEVKQDHSAYWTPELYFWGADGVVEVVPEIKGHLTYGPELH